MSKIYGPNIETITIPFPEEKYNRYLDEVGVTSEKELSFTTLIAVIIAITRDFKSGKVSLDELGEMFGHLWHYAFLTYPSDVQHRFSKIGDVLYEGSDLNYDVRHVDDETTKERFAASIRYILNFYDRRVDIQANVERTEQERA